MMMMMMMMMMMADLGDCAECEGDGLGEVGVRQQVGVGPQRDGRRVLPRLHPETVQQVVRRLPAAVNHTNIQTPKGVNTSAPYQSTWAGVGGFNLWPGHGPSALAGRW
jgi:hypothetical protein